MGHNIKILRKQKGWTQIDLAEKMGCTQGIITAYENGHKSPSVDKITTLAKLLDVTVDELIGGTERKSPEAPKNPKLWKKFEQLQKLPAMDKRTVFRMIDGLMAQTH